MALVRAAIYASDFLRGQLAGDLCAVGPVAAALTTAGAGTITAAMIAGGVIRRTGPAAGFTDTWPTSEQICAMLRSAPTQADFAPGLGVIVRYINTVAQANIMAVPSNEGISLSTSVHSSVVNCAASKWRDYFLEMGSAPIASVTVTGSTANGTKKLTLDTEAAAGTISVGMSVYGTGVGASARVTNLVYGVSGVKEVWVDVNSTADGSSIVFSIKPTIIIHSLGSGDI